MLRLGAAGLAVVDYADGQPLLARGEWTPGEATGWLTHLAPGEPVSEAALVALMNHLARQAGRLGARYLAAEVPEEGPWRARLQRAGFLPLARWRLWRNPGTLDQGGLQKPIGWLPLTPEMVPQAQALLRERVPAAVRPVLPTPAAAGGWWAYWAEERLWGVAQGYQGPEGTWIQVFLHPQGTLGGEQPMRALLALVQRSAWPSPVWFWVLAGQALEERALRGLEARFEAQWLLMARPVGAAVRAAEPAQAEGVRVAQPLHPLAPPS